MESGQFSRVPLLSENNFHGGLWLRDWHVCLQSVCNAMSLATASLAICEYAHKESENVALTIGISHFFPVKSGPQLQRYDPSVLTQSPLIHECVAFAHSSISYSQFIPS